MPNVIDKTNTPLDSVYTLAEHEGVSGLILESWGPAHRNPEYNAALDMLLTRLVELGVPYIRVNVISRPLMKRFPDLQDREIRVEGTRDIDLHRTSPHALRKEIGRGQAQLKEDPTTSSGNRTKRILLHNPIVSQKLWKAVAEGTAIPNSFRRSLTEPTADYKVLENRVDILLRGEIAKPAGNSTPKKTTQTSETFERDPGVIKISHFEESKLRPLPFPPNR